MNPLWNSLLTSAAIGLTLAFLLATGAARARFSAPCWLRMALDIFFLLPLTLPFGFATFCGANMRLESVGLLPIFYLCAVMGFRRVDRETIEAARLQGSGRCGIFWRVFFPLAWQWLLAGLAVGLFRLATFATLFAAEISDQVR